MPPRIVNFNPQVFQPIRPTQQPKSVLAQLLLSRGSQFNPNQRGSGIRSAGELLAGALLQKSAFNDQQNLNRKRAVNTGDLIKQMFPDQKGELQVGQQFNSQSPDAPSNQPQQPLSFQVSPGEEFQVDPVDRTISSGITEEDIPADPAGILQNNLFDKAQGQSNIFTTDPVTQNIPEPPGLPDSDQTLPINKPNQLGQLLAGINETNAAQGGVDPNTLLNVFQQQQALGRPSQRVDLGDRIVTRNALGQDIQVDQKGISPATRLSALTSQLNRENQQLISNNTIRSREKVADLNRQAKAGERIKVNVKLGNDKKSGRPISQVGFAKRGDPTDIKFVGQPTVQGAGNQVNVSNLPQIPAKMLTAITESKLALRQIGRIQGIIDRLGPVKFGELVGPFDSALGTLMEKAGIPNKDQQTIKTIATDMTDLLGRLRSGGVIGEEEWKSFRLLVPQREDNTQTFLNKMSDFNNKMNDVLGVNLESAQTFGFNTGSADTQDVTTMTDEQLQAIIDGR